jgi:hypothetical protein
MLYVLFYYPSPPIYFKEVQSCFNTPSSLGACMIFVIRVIKFHSVLAWWCMLVISVLGRLKHMGREFKISLGYIVRTSIGWIP